MAGPISGLGTQQQVPVSQNLQNNANADHAVRENGNERDRENNVRSSEPAAAAQETESTGQNQDVLRTQSESALNPPRQDNNNPDSERPGSLVDILV